MILDLHGLEYGAWLGAVFDHPVSPRRNGDEWYFDFDLELRVDHEEQVRCMTRMCRDPSDLLSRFTVEQIDQGLWLVFGPAYEDEFRGQLWNTNLPWPLRQDFILAIPLLWPGLFERAEVGTMSYMLWDLLATARDPAGPDEDTPQETARIHDAMFRALTEQLRSEVPETIAAALHGLGHLRHPSTGHELTLFVRRPRVEAELKDYAEAIIRGEDVL